MTVSQAQILGSKIRKSTECSEITLLTRTSTIKRAYILNILLPATFCIDFWCLFLLLKEPLFGSEVSDVQPGPD